MTVRKGGVAQAVAEGELHGHLLGVVVAIADEQPFAIAHLAPFAGEVEIGRGVGQLEREALGQLPDGLIRP